MIVVDASRILAAQLDDEHAADVLRIVTEYVERGRAIAPLLTRPSLTTLPTAD